MTSQRLLPTLLLSLFPLGALSCSDEEGSCAPGHEGCACTEENLCLSGLVCASNLCVDLDGGGSGLGGAGGETGRVSNTSSGADSVRDAAGDEAAISCSPSALYGLLRDFRQDGDHGEGGAGACAVQQDFQAEWVGEPQDNLGWPETGIPQATLGDTRKPELSNGLFKTVTSAQTFDAWYRSDEACNHTYEFDLRFTSDAAGNLSYDSEAFFPLDGRGFNTVGAGGHNFHFTFEAHMRFVYRGGESVSFTGDDDFWLYLDDHLVIDLGGVHAAMSESVELDSLGLTPGKEYSFDLFHAERQEDGSNFQLTTNIEFSNCEPVYAPEDAR